jgi:hypothetical protein
MINKSERIWKEVVAPSFKVLSQTFLGESEENHCGLSHDNRSSAWEFNPEFPECKARITTLLRRSIFFFVYNNPKQENIHLILKAYVL